MTTQFISAVDQNDLDKILWYLRGDPLWLETFFQLYYERHIYEKRCHQGKYLAKGEENEKKRQAQVALFHQIIVHVDLNEETHSWPYPFIYAMVSHTYEFAMAIIKDPRYDLNTIAGRYDGIDGNILDYIMSQDSFYPGAAWVEEVVEYVIAENKKFGPYPNDSPRYLFNYKCCGQRDRYRITPQNCYRATRYSLKIETVKLMWQHCDWRSAYIPHKYDYEKFLTELINQYFYPNYHNWGKFTPDHFRQAMSALQGRKELAVMKQKLGPPELTKIAGNSELLSIIRHDNLNLQERRQSLTVYLMAGLECDSPIVEAILQTPHWRI